VTVVPAGSSKTAEFGSADAAPLTAVTLAHAKAKLKAAENNDDARMVEVSS
jgi:hypothetical protein